MEKKDWVRSYFVSKMLQEALDNVKNCKAQMWFMLQDAEYVFKVY